MEDDDIFCTSVWVGWDPTYFANEMILSIDTFDRIRLSIINVNQSITFFVFCSFASSITCIKYVQLFILLILLLVVVAITSRYYLITDHEFK